MTSPHFPGLAGSPLTLGGVWRSARPVLILLAAVAIGAFATTASLRMIVVSIFAVLTFAIWSTARLMHRHLDEHPARVPAVVEIEVVGWVIATIAILAIVVNGFAWLTGRFPAKDAAYLVAVVAGALLGYLSKDLLKPIEPYNWFGLRFRELLTKLYDPYFYFQKGQRFEGDERARWMPDGPVATAIRREVCELEGREKIVGWDRPSRRARAEVVAEHLGDSPWDPNPNDGATAVRITTT